MGTSHANDLTDSSLQSLAAPLAAAPLTGAPLAAGPSALVAAPAERTLESRELLGGRSEVRIRHGADFYRLRITQNGKLILQK